MESAKKRARKTETRKAARATAGSSTVAAIRGLEGLERLAQRVTVRDERAGKELEKILPSLEGAAFESLVANERFAGELNSLLDRLRLRVKCPKCGEPARFVCSASNRMKNGAFFFYHTSTRHGGTASIPALRLVAKGPDKRRKRLDTTKS